LAYGAAIKAGANEEELDVLKIAVAMADSLTLVYATKAYEIMKILL
jgi:hypothetical protein